MLRLVVWFIGMVVGGFSCWLLVVLRLMLDAGMVRLVVVA